MKKWLLIAGIALLAACVLSLIFAAVNRFGYYHVMDGSTELYARLRSRMDLFFTAGVLCAALGGICMFFWAKK